MKESAIQAFGQWISKYDGSELHGKITAHEKALLFQNILIENLIFIAQRRP